MITADNLVRRDVYHCISPFVSMLANSSLPIMSQEGNDLVALCEQAQELAAPIPDYEEAAREAGWQWDEGGPHFYRNQPGASALTPYDYQHIQDGDWSALCGAEDIEPYEREVYEHWIVSDWLADKLEAKGEKVDRDFAGLTVWARTTTGQSIAIDGVIEDITAGLNRAGA